MNNLADTPAGPALVELDDVDNAIIALLREDGRMPYRTIAASVGVTEATVRSRVRRLEESDTMRVVAVTDIGAAGYDMLLAIGVQVESRSPEEVARELAALREQAVQAGAPEGAAEMFRHMDLLARRAHFESLAAFLKSLSGEVPAEALQSSG